MIAHGFLAALTFGLSAIFTSKPETLQLDRLGRLLAGSFIARPVMAAFAGCGLPGSPTSRAKSPVFFGALEGFSARDHFRLLGALIIGAVYMLRAVRAILHGPLPEQWANVADAPHLWRKAPVRPAARQPRGGGCFPACSPTRSSRASARRVIAGIAPKVSLSSPSRFQTPEGLEHSALRESSVRTPCL